ncbi:sn-glycerol-3-phosphate ABC transporter ATP-binding protein UgpC (plasmid) [Rhizobium grahamii]|uniref:sn-glycerol-3-phosphate ABC transporter ATP-binding protein UgpC n=1 Tax=Rhizobium grahamii TaxID=1120045 RepID=A0A5Q0CGW1_9HYPH|nr:MULTISPECIES: sn-glycerol-3-phosphate ABC transporter ATP-binding protein UgpC [Rhizobium]QFY63239.1 sn-glycerol-3-phosphate ABC transporter ATP-binding protein UgpC [Rhizobium grahamii]QRM51997.1 sn-glycerol-3-phosphate ABC transporter ATP-binding protein UgpC [Rhizobium sp. BG6]
MASVEISNVKKSYAAVAVMHGVDVSIKDGEFVILVGPSGCGKSTLLRMIAGLETVTSGDISIDGRRVNDLEPKDRDISMVFQNYALYPQMTVAQNMGFALELAGKSKAEIKAEVDKAADILSLTPLLERKPAQLSGGQRQRVAMGRAIVRHPKVFLFDEPLSNLDAKLRVKMRAEIKALHQRLKSTIVYVTHDQIEAMTMADKIVVMNSGRVEQIGTPLELYDRPANLFVATFMGSPAMNILPAKATQGGLLVAGIATVPNAAELRYGTDVSYGIRPDDIVIGKEGGVSAEVLVVEPTGSETHVTARLGGHEIAIVSKDRLSIDPGQMISVSFITERAHVFDNGSGRRI